MLKLKNVSKSFGNTKALQDISFEVDDGEFIFVTGASGSGKTTLLRLILRELTPDVGEIKFEGSDISGLDKNEVAQYRQKIGVVFQDYKLLPERTIKENVEVALAVIGIGQNEWEERVNQALRLVGLEDKINLFPSQLSGGEAQRVTLARAIVVNPKIILADEPTGNLDNQTANAIMELFEKVNKKGRIIIVASHNQAIIDKMGKRVISLDKGKMVGDTDKKEKK